MHVRLAAVAGAGLGSPRSRCAPRGPSLPGRSAARLDLSSWSADGATQRVCSAKSGTRLGRVAGRSADRAGPARRIGHGLRGAARHTVDRAGSTGAGPRRVQRRAPGHGRAVLVAAGRVRAGPAGLAAPSDRARAVGRGQRLLHPGRGHGVQRSALPHHLSRHERRRDPADPRTRPPHRARRLAGRAGHRPQRRRDGRRPGPGAVVAARAAHARHQPGLPGGRPDPARRPGHGRRRHGAAAQSAAGAAGVGAGAHVPDRRRLPARQPARQLPRRRAARPRLAAGAAAHRRRGFPARADSPGPTAPCTPRGSSGPRSPRPPPPRSPPWRYS